MQKNDVYKTGIFKKDAEILRVLKIKEGKALVVDCVKSKMPWWISPSDLSGAVEISEDDLLEETGMCLPEDISAVANRVMHKRFHMIAGILPFVDDKKKRSFLIEEAVRMYGVSINTVKNYLISYLVYQNILVLAPKEKTAEKKELTQDEKNMRWALNKYYYTQKKQSISTAYTQMVKEKYCDREGRLQGHYPSIHQFRYFYRKNRKMQTYYISRNGLKDYQRNYRPLVGDGVQEEFAAVGVGMLDSTICDIYLVDDSGNLVGRPILVACVDAYSSFCYGYSLLWEGGVYSLRNLMLNVVADKKEWCRRFGVLIEKDQWDCDCLPGVMVTDMGTEYMSGNFEQITELGVSVINLPAYRPELKGRVEKFFDLIQSEYKKYLKGKGVIESDYQERGAHDYRKDACLTMRDFETIILRCMVYVNYCEESALMNPRCQKLSELDAKTAEMDKEWYAKRDSKTEEPTKITKIYVTVYYAEKGEQMLHHFKKSIDIGNGHGGIVSQLKYDNEMKLTDEYWINYQKGKGSEEFQKYMEDLTDMQNHVLPYLQSFCNLEEKGVKERREQQITERNEGRADERGTSTEANAVVKDAGKADRKQVQQKQAVVGKDKKLSIHERLEINKRIIQEKQGKDKPERGADRGVR